MEKQQQAAKGDQAAATKAPATVAPLPHEIHGWADASVDELVVAGPLERLARPEGLVYLSQCRRVLKPGGVCRVVTPSLATLVNDYTKGKLDRVPKERWAPESRAQLLNEGMRSWGHLFLYDEPELKAALEEAGFKSVAKAKASGLPAHVADYGQLMVFEARP